MAQLYNVDSPINREQRKNLNATFQDIQNRLSNLRFQISILAGGADLDEIIQRIEATITNANNTTADTQQVLDNITAALNQLQAALDASQTATSEANQEVVNVRAEVVNLQNEINQLGNATTYDNAKTYQKNNVVEYNGSSFMAIQETTGNLPPVLPLRRNDYWQLLAQRGTDGNGSVSSISGISPDVNGNVSLTALDIQAAPLSDFENLRTRFNELYYNLNNFNSFEDAVANVSQNGGNIYIPDGTFRVTSDTTVPSNVKLKFSNQGLLEISTGVTLTVNGQIEAGENEIFRGGTVDGTPIVSYVSPLWFGALPGGVDCSGALNKSIGICPVTGGIIKFPHGGWWYVSGNINVNKSNIKIQGISKNGGTTLYMENHDFELFTVTGDGFEMCDLRILASNKISGYTINVSGNDVEIRNVLIDNVSNGISLSGSNPRIINVSITNYLQNTGIGLLINQFTKETGFVDKLYIHNPNSEQPLAGVVIKSGSAIQFVQCELINCGRGVWFNPDEEHNIFSMTFTDCYFDNCSQQGAFFNPLNDRSIVRTRFCNCWFSSNNVGLQVSSGNSSGITLSTCDIFDNATDGINLSNGAIVNSLNVTNSNFAGNVGSALSVAANVSDFIINANKIGPCSGFQGNAFGIYIDSGTSSNYIITNNVITGNTSGQIVDLGTGTKVVANNITS